MTETTYQTDVKELFQTDLFNDLFEELEKTSGAIINVADESTWEELPFIMDSELEKEEKVGAFELLLELFQNSNSLADFKTNVDVAYQKVENTYEENISVIFGQTKPFEKTIRSLNLLYENANGKADVYVFPVDAKKFADSSTSKHFNAMRDFLRKKFYAWKMDGSPFYLTYVGDIGSKSAMDKMADIAMTTRAMAIVDIKENNSTKMALAHAKRLQIKGIPAKLAHLMVSGTYLFAAGAKNVQFNKDENGKLHRIESKMAVPAAAALMGRLLSVRPGVFISGMEADPLVGIDKVQVQYGEERNDAKAFDKAGLIQISNGGNIQGTTTANSSNNTDLQKFPKVDAANALLKDLVQFCNNKAFSKWGKKQKRAFQKEIELYLNRRMRNELIEGYTVNEIAYDALDQVVNIDVTVQFFEVADEFEINLHGPQGGIDIQKGQGK